MAVSQIAFDVRGQTEPKLKKWVVVGPGARDGYQVPIALYEAGLLERFFTDFYAPLDQYAFAKLIPSGIRKRLQRRFVLDLPSRLAESNLPYLWRVGRNASAWTRHSHLLGEPAGRAVQKRDCGILAYSHVATSAFQNSGGSGKVLLQIQPHPVSVRAALLGDSLRADLTEDVFNELVWPKEILAKYSIEPLLADLCIVASIYTRATLTENGVRPERIRVIPYGVDLDFFHPKQKANGKFTVLFAGQIARQKGLHYLLESWRHLKLPSSELRIAGKLSDRNQNFVREYGRDASFLGVLDRHQLRTEYQNADLFCLPSLSEGFGHVVLEALACGTPVLVTQSCGTSDVIESGRNGFVVPTADLHALSESLEWAFRHRSELSGMRFAARNAAEQYPWSKFRGAVIEVLQALTGTE